jgi:hypothetical protein
MTAPELYDTIGQPRSDPPGAGRPRLLDGFYCAFWRRPEAYLDPGVRAGISVFAQVSSAAVDRAIDALSADLDTGRWHQRHRGLLGLSELHLGYYVIVAEPDRRTGGST